MRATTGGSPRPVKVKRHAVAGSKIAGQIGPAKHYNPAEQAFKTGLLLGLALGLALGLMVAGLVIWLWAVPSVEAANEAVRRAIEIGMP